MNLLGDYSLNVFCFYYCSNKDYFLRRVLLSLVAIPRVFPCRAGQISFSSVICHTLEMSHVLNIQIVI